MTNLQLRTTPEWKFKFKIKVVLEPGLAKLWQASNMTMKMFVREEVKMNFSEPISNFRLNLEVQPPLELSKTTHTVPSLSDTHTVEVDCIMPSDNNAPASKTPGTQTRDGSVS